MNSVKYVLVCWLLIFSSSVLSANTNDLILSHKEWRIISLPTKPPEGKNTVEDVFGDDFNDVNGNAGVYGDQWVLFEYNAETSKYKKLKKTDLVKQGKGYWITHLMGEAATIDMPAGSVDTPSNYSHTLAPSLGSNQWNLLGNPYSAPINLARYSVITDTGICSEQDCDLDKAKAEEILNNQVWIYDGGQYILKNKGDTIDPWNGFWAVALTESQNYSLSLKYFFSNNVPIFLIGDSTVINREIDDNGDGIYDEMGWGNEDALGSYMIYPDNLFNKAHSGASSKSYKNISGHSDWGKTKDLILSKDISNGGYLLIQFGHNDELDLDESPENTLPGKGESFYTELKVYTDWAKQNGIIPVLITSVERMNKGVESHVIENVGDYPQTVRDLATDEGVLLLDLQDKSWKEYNKYPDSEAIQEDLAYDDRTHFSPKGAKIVGGWLTELICQSNNNRYDHMLCGQFK